MKVILVALALVAVAAAASVPAEVVSIVRSEYNPSPDGGYSFAFETGDGVQKSETGEIKEILDEEKQLQRVIVVRGSYSYTDTEGNLETINYVADENGFQPEGPSIPKVPARR